MDHWMNNKGDGLRVALIDSGTNLLRDEFNTTRIRNMFFDNSSKLVNDCDDNDTIGHGTANAFIIHKTLPNATIYSIKLFDQNKTTTIVELMNALRDILKNLEVDIIHISNGITYCDCLQEFEDLCNTIDQKGIIIVSAFDNKGGVSYPAAFDSVIGVDWHELCAKVNQYYFVENSIVNVMGIGTVQRLPWIGKSYNRVAGSSFTAPYVTGIIGKLIQEGVRNRLSILSELQKSAEKTITFDKQTESKYNYWANNISKVILFPYNKEMHSLIRFKDELPFEILGVYEPYGFGKKIMAEQGDHKSQQSQMYIRSINDIDWNDDFDTVILGHTGTFQSINDRSYSEYFAENCKRYSKNLYSFDPIPEQCGKNARDLPNIYYPSVTKKDIPKGLVQKLHRIPSPVLGIFGTSPRQGKFTLQLTIRKLLKKKGYKVGQLGTEPSSLLFGMDEVYPMGYNSTVEVTGGDAVSVVNQMMYKISRKEPDVILVGSQSQSVPYTTGNIGFYPIMQHEFLLGTEPDAIILCINPNDEIPYIRRTINYFENYIEVKVLGMSMFPIEKVMEWKMSIEHGAALNEDDLQIRKNNYESAFNLPVYIMGNEQDNETMINAIEGYFSA